MEAERIEERFKALEHEVERLKSVIEIQNLASRYEYYHQSNTMEKSVELFALKQPDVSYSHHVGTWEGTEKIEGVFKLGVKMQPIGSMMEHHLTTPMIEVAKDNQTAKAVWFSPGHETIPEISPHAYWSWGRYGADFIKEGGKWKIWHWQFYPIFRCRYGKSWTEKPDYILMDKDINACPPTRWDGFSDVYKSDTARRMIPIPPDPYDTWDGISSCEAVKNKAYYLTRHKQNEPPPPRDL